ncbi:hypothetical protein G6F42_014584 [Rhizopus arrhizus]|nr:hypothetical protein G6F42_014584 [Rhizopus arrhizus]
MQANLFFCLLFFVALLGIAQAVPTEMKNQSIDKRDSKGSIDGRNAILGGLDTYSKELNAGETSNANGSQ